MGKKYALTLWIFLLVLSNINAQVFSGNLFLSSQTQIDAFNYTSVSGSLTIESFSGSIQNLNGLSELTMVGGDLQIKNTAITNVVGLSNLTSVGGLGNVFNIENNDALTNIDGLSGLISIGGNLKIIGNQVLANIDGLYNITVVGGFSSFIDIKDNPALTNINGLSNLTSINSLTINNNDALSNIDALSNLTSGSFFIQGNSALLNLNGLSGLQHAARLEIELNSALANLNGLSNLTAISGILRISSNDALTNVDELSNLAIIGGGFFIGANDALTDLNGLSSLTSVGGGLSIQFNNVLLNLDGLANLISIADNLDIRGNPALIDFCGLSELFSNGTIGGSVRIVDNGASTVTLTPPPPITRSAEQGACSVTISTTTIGAATSVGCLEEFALAHSDFPSGNIFPVGVTQVTWTVTDGAGNTATAIQTITVVDNQPPTITCPANITVKCASDVPAVDINSVVVTDNCLAVISHASDVISNQTCANKFTLTRTYKVTDAGSNTAACSQVITVYDDIPPQITGFTASKQSLWPPNHTMRDITLNYTASDNCIGTPVVTVTVNSNEPVNGTADGDTDPDWEIIDNHHIKLRAERAANGDGRVYTITVTVDDGCNPPVSQSKQVMVAHNITGPQSGKPFKVGSIVNFSGVFYDKPGNTHTAKWLLDGSAAVNGAVIEPLGNVNGKVSGSYKFNAPGVYKLQMNITDQTGITSYANTNNDLDAIVVIYDPNGGNTYGGGYFNSPAGALRSNPSATGKASYGFAMNYFKNSTNPKGETQFEFKVGEFEFNALNFDYLVISNSMAQFKGTGKIIGGQSGVGFTMTVTDGQLDGSGVDKIRMKIYNKNNGSIIYDNQPGASDAALPTQAVGVNSMIVISGTNSSLTSANTSQKGEMEVKGPEVSNSFDVIASPNPSASNFTINVSSNHKTEKITMQVVDMYGRVIETKNVNADSPIRFGDRYNPGTYFLRILQGKEHKEIKLIKLSD